MWLSFPIPFHNIVLPKFRDSPLLFLAFPLFCWSTLHSLYIFLSIYRSDPYLFYLFICLFTVVKYRDLRPAISQNCISVLVFLSKRMKPGRSTKEADTATFIFIFFVYFSNNIWHLVPQTNQQCIVSFFFSFSFSFEYFKKFENFSRMEENFF